MGKTGTFILIVIFSLNFTVTAYADSVEISSFIGGYEARTNDSNVLASYSVGFGVEESDSGYDYTSSDAYSSGYGGNDAANGYNGNLLGTTSYKTTQRFNLSEPLEGGDKITVELYFLERTLGVYSYKCDLREEETITYILYYGDGSQEFFSQPVSTKIYDSATSYPAYRSEKQFTFPVTIPESKDVIAIGAEQSVSITAPDGYTYNYNYSFKFSELVYSINSKDSTDKGILDGISNVLKAIIELPAKTADALQSAFNILGDTISNGLDWLGDRFSTMITALMTSISQRFTELFDFIKGIFIPTDEEFNSLMEEMELLADEKTGMFYDIYSISDNLYSDMISEYGYENIDGLNSLTSAILRSSGDGVFYFPAFRLTIPLASGSRSVVLWRDTVINLKQTFIDLKIDWALLVVRYLFQAYASYMFLVKVLVVIYKHTGFSFLYDAIKFLRDFMPMFNMRWADDIF